MSVDVIMECDLWDADALEGWAERACAATLAHLAVDPEAEVVVLGCDDARIAALNGAFRDKEAATNVLSWPSRERGADQPGAMPQPAEEPELGDIALAYETCRREAEAQGKPFEDHVLHLLVHGILHLLGFDHENEADAQLMESFEVEILDRLGVPDPYVKGGA